MTGSKYFGLGVVVTGIAVVASVIVVPLQWWTYAELEYFGTMWYKNKGLWDFCLRTDPAYDKEDVSCGTITEPEDYEANTRTCVTLGLLMMIVGFVASCAHKCFMKGLPMLGIAGALFMVLAGLLTWLGVVIFAGGYPKTPGNEPSHIHAGWGLTFASSLLCFLAAVLFVADRLAGNNQVYVTEGNPTNPAPSTIG